MSRPINATVNRDRHGQPLVIIDSEPFNGLEIRPIDLRAMAQHLTALADMANKLPTGGKHFRPTKVQMGLEANRPVICRPCLSRYSATAPICVSCTRRISAEKEAAEVCNA